MNGVIIVCDNLWYIDINIFFGNQSCYKAATGYQKKDVPALLQLFQEKLDQKDGTEFVLVLAISCCDLNKENPGIFLTFISKV